MSVPNLKRIPLRSEVMKGSRNFEIGSRVTGHDHLGVVLWSARSRGPSSNMSAKFEADISIHLKVMRSPKISKIGSHDHKPRPF